MKAVVFTLGCKVNEVESASLMGELEKLGFEVYDRLLPADIYVLNTCAVTREAEKKSRQLIARAKKYNPYAKIYVCGCASEKNAAQFENRGICALFGARGKQEVINRIACDFGFDYRCERLGYPKQTRTRAFIKIEDGCNNFCSYCVIPYLRGRVRSRTVSDIKQEIYATDCPEIVLTGINISAFGEGEDNLTSLITALKDVKKRIRLGSLECGVIDGALLSALKELYDFAPQFHLSLQSGSDAVLRAMNRRYTRAQFLDKCALIYRYFPDAALTTDIIVGFCGESENDFSDSLSIISEAKLARVHAFAFSPREGTKAFTMTDTPPEIKDRRLHTLLERARAAEEQFIKNSLTSVHSVIFEEFDGQYTCGYTGTYVKVYVAGNHSGNVRIKLTAPFRDGALGEII